MLVYVVLCSLSAKTAKEDDDAFEEKQEAREPYKARMAA